MNIKEIFILTIISTFSIDVTGQNTVGTILNTEEAYNGYTLFTPMSSTQTFLVNNCGEVVNQWSSVFFPGVAVYLLENGDLLRSCKVSNTEIPLPGIGGRIERYDWDNNLIWSYNYSTETTSQHHDIYPLPNGNILILAIDIINEQDVIQMGRDTALIPQQQIYDEQIIEIQPNSTGATIVWEWHISDHLIQDYDSSKDNFGAVADNPQLVDFNFIGIGGPGANWLHANSLQYNEELDQIILSTRLLGEFYIIDHSTTTSEAASHTGGIYGKGGDVLYRWGNPQVYRHGTADDKQLFGQHKPHWIANGLPDEGKIMVFNNGIAREPSFSEILVIDPPMDTPGFYTNPAESAYGPIASDYTYPDEPNENFYSPILSSGQRLENGNTLICEGNKGHFLEINIDNNIVWEYISPINSQETLSQGDDPGVSPHSVFRAEKFGEGYPAFIGRDMTAGLPIELNPIAENCTLIDIDETSHSKDLALFPNPVNQILNINTSTRINNIEIYNIIGELLISTTETKINLSDLSSGVYSVKISFNNNLPIARKIIRQ